jgi:Mg/Co/Ni transporter MgtE
MLLSDRVFGVALRVIIVVAVAAGVALPMLLMR